jgi:fumarate reductase subunit D
MPKREKDSKQALLTLIGCVNYMFVLGTLSLVGSIQPYIASYFRVSANTTQILFPTILVINTIVIPFGGQLAHKIKPRTLIAISGSILVCCLVLSSLANRD